jgi:hypothetical protein
MQHEALRGMDARDTKPLPPVSHVTGPAWAPAGKL